MMIKPQDILVVLKLLAKEWPGSFALLGKQLGISASEAHAAFHRARSAGLIQPATYQPNRSAVAEFMIHGLKYVLPVRPGGRTRGIRTGFAAAPLSIHFRVSYDDPDIPVWPDPDGESAGLEIRPLCRSVTVAIRQDPALYEWLVLADAVRGAGRARERELAEKMIRERLEYDAPR
jgi:DNA-binding Lrp family transcriptional regulator